MSSVATPVRKRPASNAEARTGNISLIPTPLEVKKSKSGESLSAQLPILYQLSKDIDGLREFHFEKLRLHREIDDTIGCYAGLARRGSRKRVLLSRSTDQVLSSAPIATSAISGRKRAATSLHDLKMDNPSEDRIAGTENYLDPESLETVDLDFISWARCEGITDIVRSFEVTRPAPSDQMTFGLEALRDYRITHPEKPRRLSDPSSPLTITTVRKSRPWRRIRSTLSVFSHKDS